MECRKGKERCTIGNGTVLHFVDLGMPTNPVDTEERMRFRDLILQVERFLKYAPQGTDTEVLSREAREFNRRLDEFGRQFDNSKVGKLQRRLRELYEVGKSGP